MTDTTSDRRRRYRARASELGAVQRFLEATELDTRMLGMIGALAVIWIGFHILSGGLFLTPRNLWNLSVQTSSVADHGDRHGAGHRHAQHRSVGRAPSGVVGMIMGVVQARIPAALTRVPAWRSVALGHRAGCRRRASAC